MQPIAPADLINLPATQPALSTDIEPLLDDRDLEKITGRARSTWQKSRLTGEGPPFIRLGRLVRYRASEFEAWLNAHPSIRSTSDAA
jgi:predicted DNA-binding transcriptional regulator AlpA